MRTKATSQVAAIEIPAVTTPASVEFMGATAERDPESGTQGTVRRLGARAVGLAGRGARRKGASVLSAKATRVMRRPQVRSKPITRTAGRNRNQVQPDPEIAGEILKTYGPLVRQIAGGFQRKLPRNVLREDLIAAGMSGLWDAIRRHADKPSDSFEWYVRVRIRGAILDELRAQDWLPRRARAAAAEAAASGKNVKAPSVIRFDDVSEWEQNRCLASGDSSNSEMAVEAKFTRASLTAAVQQLPERERHIVSSHYFRGIKFKDLGLELGVSEPRISQLHSRAMQRLRTIMAAAA